MEKRLVKKPENLSELPKGNEVIYYMPIDNPFFKNRSMKIHDLTKGFDSVKEIPIPDDHIICDNCNWNIAINKPEKIPLLLELDAETGIGFVKKAICQECVDKYYFYLICIGKPK